jgi:hypothetical protein
MAPVPRPRLTHERDGARGRSAGCDDSKECGPRKVQQLSGVTRTMLVEQSLRVRSKVPRYLSRPGVTVDMRHNHCGKRSESDLFQQRQVSDGVCVFAVEALLIYRDSRRPRPGVWATV